MVEAMQYGLSSGSMQKNFNQKLVVLLIAVVAVLPIGCENSESPSGDSVPRESSATTKVDAQCDALLETIWTMVQPRNLGVSSDQVSVAALLNEMMTNCGDPSLLAIDDQAQSMLQRLFDEDRAKRIQSDRFFIRDIDHIRDALWYRDVTRFASPTAESDLDRVVDVFYYVVRNLMLFESPRSDSPETVSIPPLVPWEFATLGIGSPEQRAWLFANLLRQMRIDAVIIQPTDQADPDDWLVGVLQNGEVYLFDMRLGIPIPAEDDPVEAPLIRRPATLQQVQKNDQLFRNLDLGDDRPYRLNSKQFQSVDVKLIGSGAYWSPRMEQLQDLLTGTRSVLLFDGLQDTEFRTGLLNRVAAAGENLWETDDISVWEFCDEQTNAFEHLTEQQQQLLEIIRAPFLSPIPIESMNAEAESIEELGIVYGEPRRQHEVARNAHLTGNLPEAIRDYLRIQLIGNFPPVPKDVLIPEEFRAALVSVMDPTIRQFHAVAAEQARYWSGVCQYERQEFEIASRTLENYLNHHRDQGTWSTAAKYLLGICLAKSGNRAAGARTLGRVDESDPYYHACQLMIKRWKDADSSESAEEESAP